MLWIWILCSTTYTPSFPTFRCIRREEMVEAGEALNAWYRPAMNFQPFFTPSFFFAGYFALEGRNVQRGPVYQIQIWLDNWRLLLRLYLGCEVSDDIELQMNKDSSRKPRIERQKWILVFYKWYNTFKLHAIYLPIFLSPIFKGFSTYYSQLHFQGFFLLWHFYDRIIVSATLHTFWAFDALVLFSRIFNRCSIVCSLFFFSLDNMSTFCFFSLCLLAYYLIFNAISSTSTPNNRKISFVNNINFTNDVSIGNCTIRNMNLKESLCWVFRTPCEIQVNLSGIGRKKNRICDEQKKSMGQFMPFVQDGSRVGLNEMGTE